MQDQQPRRSIPLGVLAGFSVLVLGTGSAIAWWTWSTHSQIATPPNSVQQAHQAQPGEEGKPSLSAGADAGNAQKPQAPLTTTADKTVQVYWLKPVGDRIQLVPSPVKLSAKADSIALIEAALSQLLAGPSNSADTTTIPPTTTLRSVATKPDGIHIDLSQDFTRGGGSTSMIGRVAQVLYTATSLNPDAAVWLSVAGKPLETLGGEGLVIEQPLTRKQFQKDFPM